MVVQSLPEKASRRYIFALAWPVMVSNFLNTFGTFVDLVMVGNLGGREGVVAVSAVGAAGLVSFFNFAVMLGISTGTVALVARSFGAKDRKTASFAMQQSLLLGVLVSIPIAIAQFVLAEPIIAAITTNSLGPEVLATGAAYLRILVLANTAFFVLFLSAAAFRGAADTRTPMYVGIAMNALNFGLNLPLIFGLGPFPRYGAVGAGIGTAIAMTVAAVAYLLLLTRGRSGLKLSWRGGFDRIMTRRLLRVGIPAGLQAIVFQVGVTIWMAMVSFYGAEAFAAHTIGLRVQSLAFMPGLGLSVAATALVGQYLGAKSPREAKRSGFEAAKMSVLIMTVLAAFNFLAAPWIAQIFTNDPGTIELTILFVRIHALSIPAVGLYFTLDGGLKGAGETRYPLYVSIIGNLVRSGPSNKSTLNNHPKPTTYGVTTHRPPQNLVVTRPRPVAQSSGFNSNQEN